MFNRKTLLATLQAVAMVATSAHAMNPTPEQLQMFQSLPPEQQQALASKYGITLPTGLNNSAAGTTQQFTDENVVIPRMSAELIEMQKKLAAGEDLTQQEDKPLNRFGLDLFEGSPTTFAPISNVPVPADYTIGVGDELVVQLYGKNNATYNLVVSREGSINFPSLGPIQVAGSTFAQLRESLIQRVESQMIGAKVDITLGKMRSMQIFVMGDAYKPGAYSVSALTTVSQAIYYSGGFAENGALRNIQLKRNGKIIRHLDLYDLLLKGDASDDIRLMPGDVVLIGAVGDTITIDGEINRPAIYELRQGESYEDILKIAGGLASSGLEERVEVKHYTNDGRRIVRTINMHDAKQRQQKAKGGDDIVILKKSELLDTYVEVEGDVRHPGYQQWRKGLRVADLFKSLDTSFNPTADIDYAVVVREINARRDITVKQISLAKAILAPNGADNILLHSKDRVIVFNRFSQAEFDSIADSDRNQKAKSLEQAQQQALSERLKQESALVSPEQEPNQSILMTNSQSYTNNQQQGQLPSNSNNAQMTHSQGMVDPAMLNMAQLPSLPQENVIFQGREITREEYDEIKSNTRRELLAPVLIRLQRQARLGLAPQIAEVFGEVRYPGRYPIDETANVESLITAAGGLTYDAYSINAELARSAVNKRDERAQTQIRRINLRDALIGDGQHNLAIQPRDRLNIFEKPSAKQQSTVVLQGEVLFPGTYTIKPGETMSELITRAGGLTEFAHPEGAVFTREALRLQEQKLLNDYAADIRKEAAKKTFRSDGNISSMISDPEKTLSFVEEASKSKALGRMVVQLQKILAKESSADFVLEDGDFLFIPTFRNTVSIMGEVQVSITYLLDQKLDVEDYLNKAGGLKKQADEDRIFVVRADGSVFKPSSSYWFGRDEQKLKPGDTIVVPVDTDFRDALSTWSAATQILYQAGVAWSAIK